MTDLTPQEHPHHSWLQRFSTTEAAVLVLVVSVMGAMIWYKKFYEPKLAVTPSTGSANEITPTPVPTDSVAPVEDNPFSVETNPFADAYANPFE